MYFTDAKSVSPGRTTRTSANSERKGSTYRGTSGLGPTRLISPISTFTSWGSSSSLSLRKIFPTLVTRASCPIVISEPWVEALCSMVRNLYILNGLRPLPTRTCLKITGPCESSLIRSEMNTRSGKVISNPRQATLTSNARFIIFCSP